MKVAIADDDPIVCSSLATILAATGAAEVPWTANSGEAAMSKYDENAPDMLLIDVQMPGMDGLTASERILHAHPDARILVLTTFADEAYIAKAMEIGTKGYLIKQDVSSVIPAVQAVMAGADRHGRGGLREVAVRQWYGANGSATERTAGLRVHGCSRPFRASH